MRLVACPACKTHLDVTGVEAAAVECPCGASVAAVGQEGLAGTVRRCAGCGASLEERATVCGYCQSPIVREPQQLTLVCPECLARNPETGKYCTGCGTEFLPQAPRVSSDPKRCPACEEPMSTQRVREVWLLACSWCHGFWVPAPSFDGFMRRVGREAPTNASSGLCERPLRWASDASAAVVYRRCPECRHRMVRKNFGRTSGVIVDWCGAHGTWFDADEIERVAAFITAGGLEPVATPQSGADEVRIMLSAMRGGEGWRS